MKALERPQDLGKQPRPATMLFNDRQKFVEERLKACCCWRNQWGLSL